MTAIRAEIPQPRPAADGRPALRLVSSEGRPVGALRQAPQVRRRHSAAVYRRRRLMVGAVAVLSGFVGVLAIDTVVGGGSGAASSGPEVYVVQPGDTVWSIAERFAAPGELPVLVEQLVRANGGSQIRVGQALVMPGR
jgi:LysM repeat protein